MGRVNWPCPFHGRSVVRVLERAMINFNTNQIWTLYFHSKRRYEKQRRM